MLLRNFEKIAGSAVPISGATVTIYPAILTGAHGAAVTFTDHNGVSGTSTTTNPDGMWEARDLVDGSYYDVKIEYNSQIKWYMGRTCHQVERLLDDRTPSTNRNILPNGGQTSWSNWKRLGSANVAISTTPVEIADFWYANVSGGGDSAVGARGTPGEKSLYLTQLTYTRVGGFLQYKFNPQDARLIYACRGRVVTVSMLVHQTTNASIRCQLNDGVGNTSSAVSSTVGAWHVISVTRTIDANATLFEFSLIAQPAAGVYTISIDNIIADYGAAVPSYSAPQYDSGMLVAESDRYIGTQTIDDTATVSAGNLAFLSEALNWYARRLKDIIGAASGTWHSAIPRTLTQLLADVQAAQATANTGVANAATAQAAANAAQATANTGVANAATAQAAANAAQTTANTGVANAATAQTTANTANSAAAAAQTSANAAATAASAAQTTANTGVTNAAAAQTTANSATTAASAAQTTANARCQIASGSYSGTGAGSRNITGLAFNPSLVIITGVTGGGNPVSTLAGINTSNAAHAINNGASLNFGDIVTAKCIAGGFTVNGTMNASGQTYFYTALG